MDGRRTGIPRRNGDTVALTLAPGLEMPPGSMVLSWPFADAPGVTRINGEVAQWQVGKSRIDRVPARVVIDLE